MIDIKISEGEGRVALHVSGHAGAGEEGNDVVCAAASILVLALWQALTRGNADALECSVKKGDAKISFKPCRRTRNYTEAIICGFDFLASTYPEYCRLSL